MAVIKILVAEDKPRDYLFLDQLFDDWVEEVGIVRVPNGRVALQLALGLDGLLVVSDIKMSELNGIEMAPALWEAKPPTRIGFWSQFKDEMYIRVIARTVPPETVYGYILKSSPRERIAAAVRTVLLEEQYWIDPEVRKIESHAGHSLTVLSDIEYKALLDIFLGLTDNLIAQRRYLSRRGVQSRLNSLYIHLRFDQEQFHCEKVGDSFNLRNRPLAIQLSRGLMNAFEVEREEAEFRKCFACFRCSMGEG